MDVTCVLLTLGVAFAFTALITRSFIGLAYRLRLVDRPGHRKTHSRSVAYLGGVALFCGLIAAVAAELTFHKCLGVPGDPDLQGVALCLALGLGGMLLGLWDDARDLRARYKLLGQLALALAFTFFGWRFTVIHLPGLPPLGLGRAALPLTVFFMLAVANGMNMIDGSDGLCAAAAGVSFLVVALAAGQLGRDWMQLPALAALGACLGILVWNRPPARIYLGDAGSQGLGFLLAGMVVALGQGPPSLPWPLNDAAPSQPFNYQLPLAIGLCAYPALEVTLSVLRRALQGRQLFRGDQGHLHHRLQRLGFNALWVLASAAALNVVAGAAVLAFLGGYKGLTAVLLVAIIGGLGVTLSQLGFLSVIRRRWVDPRRPHFAMLRHFTALQILKLGMVRTQSEALDLLGQTFRDFGLHECRLRLFKPHPQADWVWGWYARYESPKGRPDRVHLRGVGTASWILPSASADHELDMDLRVHVAEVMAKCVERLDQLEKQPGLAATPAFASRGAAVPWLSMRPASSKNTDE